MLKQLFNAWIGAAMRCILIVLGNRMDQKLWEYRARCDRWDHLTYISFTAAVYWSIVDQPDVHSRLCCSSPSTHFRPKPFNTMACLPWPSTWYPLWPNSGCTSHGRLKPWLAVLIMQLLFSNTIMFFHQKMDFRIQSNLIEIKSSANIYTHWR